MTVWTVLSYILAGLAGYAVIGYIWGWYVYIVVTKETDEPGGVLGGVFWPITFPGIVIVKVLGGTFGGFHKFYTNYLRKLK